MRPDRTSTLLLLVVSMLSACTTSAGAGDEVYVFGGRMEHMHSLVAAAEQCGFRGARLSYIGHGAFSVFVDILREEDPAFACTMDWIRTHPESGFAVPASR